MSTSSQDLPNKDNFVYKYSSKNSKNSDEEGDDSSLQPSCADEGQSSSNEDQNNVQIHDNGPNSKSSPSKSQTEDTHTSIVHNSQHVYSLEAGDISRDSLNETKDKLANTDPKKTG